MEIYFGIAFQRVQPICPGVCGNKIIGPAESRT